MKFYKIHYKCWIIGLINEYWSKVGYNFMVEKSKIGGTFQSKRGRIGEEIISQSYPDDWR